MLNTKQIRLPLNIKVQFLVVEKQRFIVLNNNQSSVFISISIPPFINISKTETSILLIQNFSGHLKSINGFHTYLKNFILNFQTPAKKTLILRGLGLKATIHDNMLKMKLGYSHENIIKIEPNSTSNFFIGKKSISIIDYNKLSLGNFAEKVYRLKKANCYKGRGLYFKQKKIVIKTIKKA